MIIFNRQAYYFMFSLLSPSSSYIRKGGNGAFPSLSLLF